MNHGKRPALVEAWIDKGNARATPNTVHTPFLITPPLFRMNAERDQSLRIVYVPGKTPLPTDRESLFWLNVLEIPPKPTGPAASQNYLQFAIRTRLKLFYRPANLPGSAIKAPGRLTFTSARGPHGAVVKVDNPTPYYITISQLTVNVGGKEYTAASGMVAPFASLVLDVKHLDRPAPAGANVAFTTINDFGGGDVHKAVVTP